MNLMIRAETMLYHYNATSLRMAVPKIFFRSRLAVVAGLSTDRSFFPNRPGERMPSKRRMISLLAGWRQARQK